MAFWHMEIISKLICKNYLNNVLYSISYYLNSYILLQFKCPLWHKFPQYHFYLPHNTLNLTWSYLCSFRGNYKLKTGSTSYPFLYLKYKADVVHSVGKYLVTAICHLLYWMIDTKVTHTQFLCSWSYLLNE